MNSGISFLTSFVAGLLSFLSPCVLPLVSSYLAFISGFLNTSTARTRKSDTPQSGSNDPNIARSSNVAKIIIATGVFIAGFGCVFVVMGVLMSGVMFLLSGAGRIIMVASGVIVVTLGLNILFDFIPFLNYEKSFLGKTEGKRFAGLWGPFIAGLAFGAGWTPCVGPILGGILLMASQSGQAALAAAYLAVYSLGLGVPFLLTALFWGRFLAALSPLKRLIPAIRVISGVFICVIGVLIAAGRFSTLSSAALKHGYALARWAESGAISVRIAPACVLAALGLIPLLAALLRKTPPRLPGAAFSIVCVGIGALNAAGVINIAALFSAWLMFMGV